MKAEEPEYGFPVEPKVRIMGCHGEIYYVNATEVCKVLNDFAESLNDPWPFQLNWEAVREAQTLGYKFGPVAMSWADYGEREARHEKKREVLES